MGTCTRHRSRVAARGIAVALGLAAIALVIAPHIASATSADGVPIRMQSTPFSSTAVILIVIALAVDNIAGVVFSVTTATVRQSATPDALMAPVMAINYTLCGIMVAVGTFGGGLIGSHFGPSDGILVGCAVYLLAGVSAMGRPLGTIQMYRQPFLDTFSRTFTAANAGIGTATAHERLTTAPAGRRRRPALLAREDGALVCTRTLCPNADVEPCAYTGSDGIACGTTWCGEHGATIAGRRVCQRHERVLAGTGIPLVSAAELPAVNNWAASLVVWIGSEMGPQLFELLDAHFPQTTGFVVTRDQAASVTRGSARAWQFPWTVAYRGSIVVTVMLEVEEENDKVLIVAVNNREVAREVPPWISLRTDAGARSRLDEAHRARFYAALIARIEAALP